MAQAIKSNTKEVNEVASDSQRHWDPAQVKITPVYLALKTDQPMARNFQQIVSRAHAHGIDNSDGVESRAQVFEEGPVYHLSTQSPLFGATSYLMSFPNSKDEGCSRVHMHTGMRFVCVYTGPDSYVDVSSFSPFTYDLSALESAPSLNDRVGFDEENKRPLYQLTVPPNSMVIVQIPKAVSHGFNAFAPTKGAPVQAAVLSVHPEEWMELEREGMDESHMRAQTVFLQEQMLDAAHCYPEEHKHHSTILELFSKFAHYIVHAVMSLYRSVSNLHSHGHQVNQVQQDVALSRA